MLDPPLGFLMSHLAGVLRERTEKRLTDIGLSPREYGLLWRLDDGPLSQRELGTLHRIDRTTVVSLVDRLEATGLVVRAVDPTDRRRHALSLTDEGRELLGSARTIADDEAASFTSALSVFERDQLIGLLVKILESDQR